MKKLLTIVLLCAASACFAQSPWESWDRNYKQMEYADILQAESDYAASVEQNPDESQYYARVGKYRIEATYLDKHRPIDPKVMQSMKNVFKFFSSDPPDLDEMVDSEVLMKVDGKEVWFPIQSKLVEPLQSEIKKGAKIMLYCMFMNEHTPSKELFNTFLISEFRTE